MKYIKVKGSPMFGTDNYHCTYTEEELHEEFLNDNTVRHDEGNYAVWKKTKTDINYVDGYPEYLPLDEKISHVNTWDIEPVLVQGLANMLDLMSDTIGKDNERAKWTLSFDNGQGKSVSVEMDFLIHIFEPMEDCIHSLITSITDDEE